LVVEPENAREICGLFRGDEETSERKGGQGGLVYDENAEAAFGSGKPRVQRAADFRIPKSIPLSI